MTAKRKPREEMSEAQRAAWGRFDVEVQKGFSDIEGGRLKEADEVFDRLEAKYQAMSKR